MKRADYRRLSDAYEAVLDDKLVLVVREFGEDVLADLLARDRSEYDRLREAGRRSVFEVENQTVALRTTMDVYEAEAKRSAAGGAPIVPLEGEDYLVFVDRVVQQLRLTCNLVHPGRYVSDRVRREQTAASATSGDLSSRLFQRNRRVPDANLCGQVWRDASKANRPPEDLGRLKTCHARPDR